MVKPVNRIGVCMYTDQSTMSQAHLYIKLAIAELATQQKTVLNDRAIEYLRWAEEMHLGDIFEKKKEAKLIKP